MVVEERTISEQRHRTRVEHLGVESLRYTRSDLWTHGTLMPLPGSIVCLELVYLT